MMTQTPESPASVRDLIERCCARLADVHASSQDARSDQRIAANDLAAVHQLLLQIRDKYSADETTRQDETQRVEEMLHVLFSLAGLDFSARATVRGDGGRVDALAAAINMLSEELEAAQHELAERNKALQAINEDLRNELEERKRLMEAREAAEAANKAKSRFLATMSHEIRTPMNGIIGMTHLLLRTPMTGKQQEYASTVLTSANALLRVINDILDFSKVEADKLELDRVSFYIDDVFHLVTSVVAQALPQKPVELLYRIGRLPHQLFGDPGRLGQVLVNLTNNALKFTERGEVVVSVQQLERDAQMVHLQFSVRDTGLGISQEKLDSLFLPFSQLDQSTTRKYGGTGLGLSICKKLVTLMKGQMQVSSQIGVGSTFGFDAWFEVDPAADAVRSRTIPNLSGVRALVVDDNASAREILCGLLADFDVQATGVASGADAVRQIVQDPPGQYQLVLLDWSMPEMDGIQTATAIRNLSGMEHVSIVMVTAFGHEDVRQAASLARIDEFLTKPVSPSSLYNTLLKLVGNPPQEGAAEQTQGLGNAPKSHALKAVRILLVEDYPINQQIAVELLESSGAGVTVAQDGQEAVDILFRERSKGDASPFDVVLMDVQMPVLDGRDATRHIRADARFAQLPIIGLTAHALPEERQQCIAAGMNDLVTKPIDPLALISTVQRWVRQRSPSHPPPSSTTAPPAEQSPPQERGSKDTELSLPGVDTEAGLRRTANNRLLYVSLLRKLVGSLKESLLQIEQSIAAGQARQAASLVHGLKGVAGNLGANDIWELSASLEQALGSGQETLSIFQALTAAAMQLIERLPQLDDALAVKSGSGTEPVARDTQVQLLRQLQTLLAASDAAALSFMEEIWDRVKDDQVLPAIRAAVLNLDFDEALQRLEPVLATR